MLQKKMSIAGVKLSFKLVITYDIIRLNSTNNFLFQVYTSENPSGIIEVSYYISL